MTTLAPPQAKEVAAGPRRAELAAPRPGAGVVQRAYALQRAIGNRAVTSLLAKVGRAERAAVAGGGRPLDAGVRAAFEPRFGASFADVRVHDDAEAAGAAREAEARAYTLGNHIVFGAGAYAPHRDDGRATLAHELAHVVQQRGAAPRGAHAWSSPAHPAELEADTVAAAAARSPHGPLAVHQRAPAGVVHRQHVHMASGRFVGDVPGPDNNLREEVIRAIDKLAGIGCMSPADYGVEYPAVNALPAASSVPIASIPKTIAGITCAEVPVLDATSASTQLSLPLTGAVGRGQANAQPDILAMQDQLHQDWHLGNTDYAAERAAVAALPAGAVPDATIPRTIAGIGEQKVAIVAGQTGQDYRHQLGASVKMQRLVGSTAKWVGSGPGSGNTFERWASAATAAAAGPLPAVLATTMINCWEMVLVAALQASLINWQWVHNLYTTSVGPGWGAHLVATLTRGTRTPYHVNDANSPRPNRGQIVFFNGAAHVAMATGTLLPGAPAQKAQIWTFWPPPGTPFTPGGTIDQVKESTIEDLSAWMLAHFGAAPTVELSQPPW